MKTVRRKSNPAIALVLFAGVVCQAQPTLEYEVKAAFLLNFTRFIDWPTGAFPDASSPFAMCIVGKDPFGAALDEIVKGETVSGRRLVVRRIKDKEQMQGCQLAYIGTNESAERPGESGRGGTLRARRRKQL